MIRFSWGDDGTHDWKAWVVTLGSFMLAGFIAGFLVGRIHF